MTLAKSLSLNPRKEAIAKHNISHQPQKVRNSCYIKGCLLKNNFVFCIVSFVILIEIFVLCSNINLYFGIEVYKSIENEKFSRRLECGTMNSMFVIRQT